MANRSFIWTSVFCDDWKRLGLTDSDARALENEILANPEAGAIIPGTGGARKLRIELSDGRGKRGGGRVIYIDIVHKGRIYLLNAYAKCSQTNLTPDQTKAIKKQVDAIKS